MILTTVALTVNNSVVSRLTNKDHLTVTINVITLIVWPLEGVKLKLYRPNTVILITFALALDNSVI